MMNEKFTDELISAYLDGELTSDQQAQVEQALLDSVEHRRMFEELRALRGTLQSLPSHQLDNDFCKRVLRRAERAMLAPDSEESFSGDSWADAEPGIEPPVVKIQPAAPRRWYGVAVAVSTVAAASLLLALFVFSDLWNDNNPVAKGPESPHGEQNNGIVKKDEKPNARSQRDRKKTRMRKEKTMSR